jgi:hypothetical protein
MTASTQRFSLNLGIGATPETENAELYAQVSRIYGAIRTLAAGLDSYTGALQQDQELWDVLTPADTLTMAGMNRLYVPFSEIVTLGQIVTLWDNAGILTAKKAGGNVWAGDARGYCSTDQVLAPGDFGEVILLGLHPYISGATRGALYYLSNVTAGTMTTVKPVTAGNKIQPVGYALSTTELFFNPGILVPTINTALVGSAILIP